MSAYELEQVATGDPAVLHVSLAGEIDLTNVRELEDRLESMAPADARLVLDLNRVTFLDSAALHLLFRLTHARNGRVGVMLAPDVPILRTLEIVGLPSVIPVRAHVEDLAPPSPG